MLILNYDNHRIQLLNEKIQSFQIGNKHFLPVIHNNRNKSTPETGFYELLYEGKIALFKKHIKIIRETASFSADAKQYLIDSSTKYYLLKEHEYFQIKDRNDFLDLTADKKREMQQAIKTNHLNFKKEADHFLAYLAGYYDQITN